MRAYTTDFSNRQVDVEMMQTIVKPTGITLLDLSLTTQPVKAITGMQKLVQRYLITFLTRIGDVHFDPDFGSEFWTDMLSGAIQNSGGVVSTVSFANLDVISIMQAEDANEVFGTIPEDEQIDTATLDDFNVDTTTGTLYLKIVLTNKAGDTYTYVLPMALSGSNA